MPYIWMLSHRAEVKQKLGNWKPKPGCDYFRKLDDVSVSNIFARISISDLASTGQVNRFWNRHSRTAAEARNRLILLIGPREELLPLDPGPDCDIPYWAVLENDDGRSVFGENPKNITGREMLLFDRFQKNFAKFMVDFLPGITDLEVRIKAKQPLILDPVIYLLEQWGAQLTSLKFSASYDDKHFHPKISKNIVSHVHLLAKINSVLPELKKLYFKFDGSLVVEDECARIKLPILAQLEQVNFISCDDASSIVRSLKDHAAGNKNLKSIHLGTLATDYKDMLKLKAEFASRFTHLYVEYTNDDDFMDRLCGHFSELTSIHIKLLNNSTLNRDKFVRSIGQLTKLISLEVDLTGGQLESLAFDDTEQVDQFAQFTALKALTLSINPQSIKSHDLFDRLRLDWFVPNLQVLQLMRKPILCAECKRKKEDPCEYEWNCLYYMLNAFLVGCPKMKLVKANDNDEESFTGIKEYWLDDLVCVRNYVREHEAKKEMADKVEKKKQKKKRLAKKDELEEEKEKEGEKVEDVEKKVKVDKKQKKKKLEKNDELEEEKVEYVAKKVKVDKKQKKKRLEKKEELENEEEIVEKMETVEKKKMKEKLEKVDKKQKMEVAEKKQKSNKKKKTK